ncbi:MAG: hypothetical protein EGR93_00435 [Prevotella sp.]|nr:hypothetical protein [Prevotella sp.]
MGLITWIKDKYYNHILNSADELYASNDISRAEQIYMDILGKQPDAAEHLAKMYCEIAESGKDELKNLSKIKDLLARVPFGKNDLIPYHTRVVRHIEATADNDFKNKKYARASRFLKAIEIDKRGNTAFAQKNRIYSLYVSLNAVEYDTSYKSALSTIDTYCNNVDKEVEDAILGTVTRLHKYKKLDRAYLLANCLAKKSHKQAINDCIAIALDIYKNGNSPFKKTLNAKDILNYIKAENPSDLIDGLEPFVPYSSTFADAYLESGTLSIGNASQDNRLSLFKRVWKHTPDVSLVEKFACPSEPIAKDVISYFIDNTDSLTQKATFTSSLLKMIQLFEDNFYILDTLEQLKHKKIHVHSVYISTAKKVLKNANSNEDKSKLIERCLLQDGTDSWAIQEKLRLASQFELDGKDETAKRMYEELIGLHASAQPKLAALYYKQSRSASDETVVYGLIENAFDFKLNHDVNFDKNEYQKTYKLLVATVITIISNHFDAGKPDDAYIAMKRYSVYNDGLYNSYISILKDYKDTEYVLSKLQFLRNSGKDIKADYIEVVDKLCKQAKIANKYKQELLARTYDLFKDNTIYNKYISTSISVIKEMTEKDIALSEFSKVWKKFQDAKLLAEFVNDKYPFFKEVTEFLVEWFTVSKQLVAKQKEFCDCIFTFKDYSYALDIFERLNAKGMNVHTPYVAVILKAIPTLDADGKLQLINRGLSKFTDANLFQEKHDVATLLIINGDLDKAKSVLQELIGHHKDAEPSLALVAYKNYKKVQSLDKKEEYLTECLSFDTKHSNPFDQETYKPTFVKALKSFIHIIDKHVKTDNISEARRLCLSLKSYSSDWYEKYLVIVAGYLSKIAASNEIAASIYSCFDTLSANEVDIKNLNSDIIIGLWDSLFKAELTNAQEMTYEDSTSHLQKLCTYVSENCYADKEKELLKNITSELVAIHKKEGYKQEGAGNIDKAISSYNCLSSVGDVRSKTWAKIRTTICQLKKGTSLKEKDVLNVLSYVGFAKEKKDLSYRYGIWLIKNTSAKNALDFIKEHLPNEDELIDICNNEYIVEAEASLAELNASIEDMTTGKMSLSDATKLASKIDSYDATISPYLKNVHSKIISLKESIQSYILSKSFEEGDYKLALKLLKDTGASWFLDDIYFRNVAIACLGIAENGLLNKLNYKEVISYWLTAVYRDQLFVQSLDYTSWDDSYTFTLYNSMGGSKEESFDTLPDNVNFDEAIKGTVISICEVQQSLLGRFEAAIESLDDFYRQFYDAQKDAMDSLVKLNLDHPCMIAAPYLANNTRKCINKIKGTLDYEYDNYRNENTLKVGLMYNLTSGVYGDYKTATTAIDDCSKAILTKSVVQVNSAFCDSAIDSIREFPDLYSSFVVNLQNALSSLIKDEADYKTVMSLFIPICRLINDSTIAYMFGNHINQCVVGELNDEKLDLATGLEDMVSVYEVAKNCSRLKDNIGNVIEALIGKYVTEEKSTDLSTLKTVLSKTGREFEPNVEKTLTEQVVMVAVISDHFDSIKGLATISANSESLRLRLSHIKDEAEEASINLQLSQIVDKVNNNKILYYSALQKVYSLYKVHQNNKRVCENLCTLVGMCIREYVIPDKVGKSTVMTIFDKLKYNKSTTYKSCASSLREERENILGSLPYEARRLLTGGTAYGSTLNAEGIRLKNALQLYLDLA